MHTRPRLSTVALACLVAAACSESPVGPARQLGSLRSVTPATTGWAMQINGVTADGAQYAIYVPNGWNRDVVFYAHGILPPLLPVGLPAPGNDWDSAEAMRSVPPATRSPTRASTRMATRSRTEFSALTSCAGSSHRRWADRAEASSSATR